MNSIKIQKIGITDLDTDAIVNAANDGLCRDYRHRFGAVHISGRLREILGTCTDVPCLLESI